MDSDFFADALRVFKLAGFLDGLLLLAVEFFGAPLLFALVKFFVSPSAPAGMKFFAVSSLSETAEFFAAAGFKFSLAVVDSSEFTLAAIFGLEILSTAMFTGLFFSASSTPFINLGEMPSSLAELIASLMTMPASVSVKRNSYAPSRSIARSRAEISASLNSFKFSSISASTAARFSLAPRRSASVQLRCSLRMRFSSRYSSAKSSPPPFISWE